MIVLPCKMIGTEKQVAWAQRIKGDFHFRYPGEPLPENLYAQFWIDNRDLTPEQLCKKASTEIHSPFTTTYPKFMRADVEPLLKNMHNFAVLDTETSGLLKNPTAEIVDLTIIHVTSGEVLFNSLFKPYDMEAYLSSEAREKMHAFPEEDYLKAPTFPEEWETIQRILSHYHPLSYNAEFDFQILRRTAQIWGLPAPRIKCTCAMKMFQAFMATDTSEGGKYAKFEEACKVMGVDQEKFGVPHTALADTLALRELLLHMQYVVEHDGEMPHEDE